MKIKKLLPIALMATALLIGCGGGGGGSSFPSEHDDGHHAITIDNVSDLQAVWYEGGVERIAQVTLKVDGQDVSTDEALYNDELVVTSQDAEVVSVNGLTLTPGKEGTTKVAFKFFDTVKHLELTVSHKPTNKELYGTDHEGNAADPFTGEDAIKVATALKAEGSYPVFDEEHAMYVSGKVQAFYHKPGSRTTQCSWFYEAANETGETTNKDRFEAYCINILDESGNARNWVESDIAVGQTAVIKVFKFADYNGQWETAANQAVLVSVSGQGETIETHEVTVAEAMTVVQGLGDNVVTKDLYQMVGKVIAVTDPWASQYGNVTFSIGDTVETAEADRLLVYRFKCAEDAVPAIGCTITVKGNLKNHKLESGANQYELTDPVAIGEYEHAVPVVVDPTEVTFAEAVTLAKALADGATSTELYKISGYVIKVTYNWSNGTMSFLLGGAADTAEADCLTVFKLACDEDKAPAAGAQVVITGNLQNYVKNEAHTYEVVNGKLISSQSGGEGGGGGEDTPAEVGANLSLTAANVLGYSGTNVSYAAGEATVEGVKISYTEIGAFGNGIQMRVKDGRSSNLHNVPAFSKGIDRIEITLNSGKTVYDNTDVWAFKFGTTSACEAETINLSTVANQLTYTVTPTAKTNTYFDMTKIIANYTFYVDSINIVFVGE